MSTLIESSQLVRRGQWWSEPATPIFACENPCLVTLTDGGLKCRVDGANHIWYAVFVAGSVILDEYESPLTPISWYSGGTSNYALLCFRLRSASTGRRCCTCASCSRRYTLASSCTETLKHTTSDSNGLDGAHVFVALLKSQSACCMKDKRIPKPWRSSFSSLRCRESKLVPFSGINRQLYDEVTDAAQLSMELK